MKKTKQNREDIVAGADRGREREEMRSEGKNRSDRTGFVRHYRHPARLML